MSREVSFGVSMFLFGLIAVVMGSALLIADAGAITAWTPSVLVAGLICGAIGASLLLGNGRRR